MDFAKKLIQVLIWLLVAIKFLNENEEVSLGMFNLKPSLCIHF